MSLDFKVVFMGEEKP